MIAGDQTVGAALELARATGEAMDKRVIVASDGPGFLVNRCGRPFYTEALRLLQERVATHEQIDRICRLGGGFRMGPFELMDLVGIDTGFEVAKSFEALSFGEPRWRPNPIQARMVAAAARAQGRPRLLRLLAGAVPARGPGAAGAGRRRRTGGGGGRGRPAGRPDARARRGRLRRPRRPRSSGKRRARADHRRGRARAGVDLGLATGGPPLRRRLRRPQPGRSRAAGARRLQPAAPLGGSKVVGAHPPPTTPDAAAGGRGFFSRARLPHRVGGRRARAWCSGGSSASW